MGMVVRTNMAAINANNSLQQASKAQQNGMQKLASGFKINKAADDASGLAISEKMKAQIKALDTAKDNCEDGANLIQTAEGYMNETHDMLNRMVELSEKAANGVLEDTDRDALQEEMNQLCGEIDRMATTANFNGRKLMDGSIGSSGKVKITSDPTTGKNGYALETTEDYKTKFAISGGSANISGLTGTNVKGDASAVADSLLTKGTDNEKEALASKITDAIYKAAEGDEKAAASMDKLKEDLDAKQAEYDKALAKFNDDNKANGAVSATLYKDVTTALNALTTAQSALTNGKDAGVQIQSKVTVYVNNAGDVYATLDANDKKAQELEKDIYDSTSNDKGYQKYEVSIDLTSEKMENSTNEGIKLQIGESSTAADKMEVKIDSFHTDTLLGGIDGFQNRTAESTNETDQAATAATMKNETATYKDGITIDISDQDKASAAADALRQVSNYVSDQRGRLGAQQNRLDHTVNNLSTASENVSAANSRIRDTDMAKEMMAYTSKNVIAQAAQSMLAQANSQPQNVLSLLQ